MSDLVVDKTILRAKLRFVSTTSGVQFILTFGQPVMEMWSADNLDSLQLVYRYIYTRVYYCNKLLIYTLSMGVPLTTNYIMHSQVQLLIPLLPLVKELALSGLIMCTALVLKVD